ncbi:MAG: Penicillin-binding protein 2 [Parcubacteria group bacterium Athens0714_16]|nr:MAG: Penicillin-binding protein 2 [Parcubacteria group bacterium Athens0714_16]
MFFLHQKRKTKRPKYSDIDPDEIFADSHNFPNFDKSQLEGRIEKPISKKSILGLGIVLLLICFVFVSKIWILQIKKGESYLIESEQNHLKKTIIFAKRGVVYDRNKELLVWNTKEKEEDFYLRKYTNLGGFSHLLGFINYPLKDNSGFYYQEEVIGMSGVEKFFNEQIGGVNGSKISEIDALMNVKSESTIWPPVDGEDIVLSIDSKVQNKLYENIKSLSQSVGFSGGAGVIMDIKTGEIIAITSYPEFDSQIMSDGIEEEKIRSFVTNTNKPFLDRVNMGLYTPGSIVKPFMAIGALNENIIKPETQILSMGQIEIQNPYDSTKKSVFKDWKAHGWVDLKQALAVSSNVYFYEIGGGFGSQRGLGIEKINSYVKAFGLGEETGINLYESSGIIPSPEWKKENFDGEVWRLGDTYNTAIGQYGFQVTPIQMVRGVATIANNGGIVTPTVLFGDQINVKKIPIDIPQKFFDAVKGGMRESALTGTAKGLNIVGFDIAAKTGTAELGTVKKTVNSWAVGFFPYKNPKYAFAVVMEKGPRDNVIGGVFVMRGLFDWMIQNTPEYTK